MASKPLTLGNASAAERLTLGGAAAAAGLGLTLAIELLMRWCAPHLPLKPLAILGAGRVLQVAGMLWAVVHWEGGLSGIGWSKQKWARGFGLGLLWSLGFAAAAGLGMLLIYFNGSDPLSLVRSPMSDRPAELALFFLVGGLVAPVAEEICFRGILYTYFRRWGIAAALLVSTAVFVLLHSGQGLPLIQIVGGLLFALAFEISRNLMVPMTIHMLGNLALFSLSLPLFR